MQIFDDKTQLIPAIVQDAKNGKVLMLAYMNEEALNLTQSTGFVHFYSRSRKSLWRKGESSGNQLIYRSLSVDCDKDTILVQAEPLGPTCHLGTTTCFSDDRGHALEIFAKLDGRIQQRLESGAAESYSRKLLEGPRVRIAQKIGEEGVELALAMAVGDRSGILEESADLLFHLQLGLHAEGLTLHDVAGILSERYTKGQS